MVISKINQGNFLKEEQITRENIAVFVVKFYENILEDKEVGPFFIDILGDDIQNKKWQEHIEILIEFWGSMLIQDGDYIGSFFEPHEKMIGLKKETFAQWLMILDVTLEEIYDEKCSQEFRKLGQVISKSFIKNLNL